MAAIGPAISDTETGTFRRLSAWREGHRRDDNGTQTRGAVGLALKARPSVDFLRILAASDALTN